MTLKDAVEGIKKCEEERRLVSKFENEHRDEINEILGSIECIHVEKSYPEIYNFGLERLGVHLNDGLALREYSSDSSSRQLDYFRKAFKAYEGQDADADKYVERVKAFIDKPLDGLGIKDVGAIKEKKLVKFPCRLEIPVFYELTGRLPHEELEFNERNLIIHFYNTFMAASERLFEKPVMYRVNVLYHLLKKISKGPNADLFSFMKEDSHQRTEEEIEFVFKHLGCSYSPIPLGKRGLP